MLPLWLAGAALADPETILAEQLARVLQADCQLGRQPTRREWVACFGDREPPPAQAESWALLTELQGAERAARDGRATLSFRPVGTLAGGTFTPLFNNGDTEPGLFSARVTPDLWAAWGPVEAEVAPRALLDVGPTSGGANLVEARVTAHWRGLSLELGQRPRSWGPQLFSSLSLTNNALPLPGVIARAEGRLPGWFDRLGRLGIDVGGGVVPGARSDVDLPAWLVEDFRWEIRPEFEIGATRTSMFGGSENDIPVPVDWGEVALPVSPHTYGDPSQSTPDTDERIALDARLTLPLRKWTGFPVDSVEGWYQYGGEDSGTDKVGLPSIVGVATTGGAQVAVWPVFVGFERSIVEDDYHRWYTGHRVYHEGWTEDGLFLGHPWGGDSRSYSGWVGVAGLHGWVGRLGYTWSRVWQVADVLNDHVFVFPAEELWNLGTLELDRRLPRYGWLSLEATAGQVENLEFVPGNDEIQWRVAVSWRVDGLAAHAP